MKKIIGTIMASAVLATSLLGFAPDTAEATEYPIFTGADEQRFEQEFGVPMWVDTSSWPARTTYVHRCYERHHMDTLVDQGFGTDSSGNPYTSSAEQGTAAYSVSLQNGLDFSLSEDGTFPSSPASTERTAFGNLIDEVRTTSNWDGDPDALKSAAVSARSSANSFSFTETLSPAQRKAIERGGVFNVVETKVEGRIAASNNERDLIRVRGYDCGFDYMRTRSDGSIETGTTWFLASNLRDRSADPYDSYSLNASQVGMARYNAIQGFSWRDIEHGGLFRRFYDISGNDTGLREAWRTADCMYSEQIFTNSNQNNPSPSRHRIGANGGNSTAGACGIRSSMRPQISHQMPYTEMGMILRSYRYWDPETEGYHALYQYRAGGSVPSESNDAHNGIWHNEAPAEFYDIDRMPYSSSEPGFDDTDRYTESEAFSEQFSTHIPHRAYQVMHVVCNPEGADGVRADSANGAATYNHTDQDYSSLIVSAGYDGQDIEDEPDFGRNSGNDSEHRDFYTKECEFDPDDVSGGEHTVNNPSSSAQGMEAFGKDSRGSNHIAMMRDNVPSTVIFDVQDNPTISSSHVSSTEPAYTLISRTSDSSVENWVNFTARAGSEDVELFEGEHSGVLHLTNDSLPSRYSSDNVDLVEADLVDGFVDTLEIASPWVSVSSKPEMFNVSYAWKADLMSHIPNSVSVGNTGSEPSDRIRSAEAVRVPIVGRSYVDMGGTDDPSQIADVSKTSGSGTNVAHMAASDMEREASNSLVFEFIRSVSER